MISGRPLLPILGFLDHILPDRAPWAGIAASSIPTSVSGAFVRSRIVAKISTELAGKLYPDNVRLSRAEKLVIGLFDAAVCFR